MNKRVRNALLISTAAVALLIAGVFIHLYRTYLWEKTHRPLFYTHFEPSDRWPIPHWQINPPSSSDMFGNLYYLDATSNIFVAIATGDLKSAPMDPPPEYTQARLGACTMFYKKFWTIPNKPNTLFIITTDGVRHEYPLRSKEALDIYQMDFGNFESHPTDPFPAFFDMYEKRGGATTQPSNPVIVREP